VKTIISTNKRLRLTSIFVLDLPSEDLLLKFKVMNKQMDLKCFLDINQVVF